MPKRPSATARRARALELLEFTSWQFVSAALPPEQNASPLVRIQLKKTAYAVRGDARRFCERTNSPNMTVGEFADKLNGRSPGEILRSKNRRASDEMIYRLFARFGITVKTRKKSKLSEQAHALLNL